MVPLATRSSSPKPPSVMVKVAALPAIVAGSTYQCGVALPGAGPYFQYCAPTGSAAGYVTVKVSVEPAAQPTVLKVNRPCGNNVPGAGVVGGTGVVPGGAPMKAGALNVHPAPPPVKLAVMVPLPVADGPENVFSGAAALVSEKLAGEPTP